MSLFRLGRREVRSGWPPPTDSLAELIRRREPALDSGVYVDGSTAARHGAVFACKDLIAREISTLPVDEFRKSKAGVFEELPRPTVLMSPDGELDIADFNYQVLDAALGHGNAFALIERYDAEHYPAQIRTLPNGAVTWETRKDSGRIQWRIDGKRIEKYPQGDLWHFPAYLRAGSPVGLSPLRFAALTIGHGLSAQQFASRYFRDGAIPTALLTNEAEVGPELAQLVLDRYEDALAGNRKAVALGDDWKVSFPTVSANESQFLEAIRANAGDVCKFFGVDPSDIGVMVPGASRSYQSVEAAQIQLLVRTLGPWIIRLERAWSRLRPGKRYVRFNINELLRLDTVTLIKKVTELIRNGVISVNEGRALFDRPGIGKAGERYLWPPMRSQLDELEMQLGTDSDSPGATDPELKPEPEEPPAPVRVPEPVSNGQGGT